MNGKSGFLLLLLLGMAVAVTGAKAAPETDAATQEIQSLIEASYINGAFNALDTKTMREGFHPSFAIHGVRDGALSRYPIDEWIAGIDKRKAAADFDASKEKWDHKFVFIDVTGNAAVAKIELSRQGKHVYTDYLSLLKLADGWKITDKVYYRHPER
jgi:hypothetical protein